MTSSVDMSRVMVLLRQIQQGELSAADALEQLENQHYQDLGFAKLDHNRRRRTGLPEAVFAAGKPTEQLVSICQQMLARQSLLLVTQLSPTAHRQLASQWQPASQGRYHPLAQTLAIAPHLKKGLAAADSKDLSLPQQEPSHPQLLILCAGTADLPTATEALETAQFLGCQPRLIADVGIAGIQRLLAHQQSLEQAQVVIAVAGMDGALPAATAGLTPALVIAVPTSVGYGTGIGGLSAVLTMLNSCAPGVLVVNVDNGYGAACAAALILKKMTTEK